MTRPLRLIAEVSIVRALTESGEEVDEVSAVDGNGDPLPLGVALRMLRAAETRLVWDDGGGP
jgi:hypothetical protein